MQGLPENEIALPVAIIWRKTTETSENVWKQEEKTKALEWFSQGATLDFTEMEFQGAEQGEEVSAKAMEVAESRSEQQTTTCGLHVPIHN